MNTRSSWLHSPTTLPLLHTKWETMILFVPYNSPIAQMNCHQLIPFVAYINIATNIVLHNIKSNKSGWNERDIVFQTSCEETYLYDILGIDTIFYSSWATLIWKRLNRKSLFYNITLIHDSFKWKGYLLFSVVWASFQKPPFVSLFLISFSLHFMPHSKVHW